MPYLRHCFGHDLLALLELGLLVFIRPPLRPLARRKGGQEGRQKAGVGKEGGCSQAKMQSKRARIHASNTHTHERARARHALSPFSLSLSARSLPLFSLSLSSARFLFSHSLALLFACSFSRARSRSRSLTSSSCFLRFCLCTVGRSSSCSLFLGSSSVSLAFVCSVFFMALRFWRHAQLLLSCGHAVT